MVFIRVFLCCLKGPVWPFPNAHHPVSFRVCFFARFSVVVDGGKKGSGEKGKTPTGEKPWGRMDQIRLKTFIQ